MLPAIYFGVRYFGLVGAASAFVSTRSIIVISEIVYSKYILSLKWGTMLPFKYMAKIAVLSFACLILPLLSKKFIVFTNSWLQLFYLMLITFLSYVYITNFMGYWSVDGLPISDRMKSYLKVVFCGRRCSGCISVLSSK